MAHESKPDWKRLALHALHDLRAVGIPIEKISGVTPEVIAAVDDYDREMSSYA